MSIVVLDFGGQYAQLIARRIRDFGVHAVVVPHTVGSAELDELNPGAIILSGGPASVHETGAPELSDHVLHHGVPVLGICYGMQLLAQALGGAVTRTGSSEFGRTLVKTTGAGRLMRDEIGEPVTCWMSHRDGVTTAPPGAIVTAESAGAPIAAFELDARSMYAVQFHPEVVHTEGGSDLLERFVLEIAGVDRSWTTSTVIEHIVDEIRSRVGTRHVLCALSGGVDSAVAAALVHEAVGSQLVCVFVDHGLLRAGERDEVEGLFEQMFGAQFHVVDARDRFLAALAGVSDPEQKRRIIGESFIRVFEQSARDLAATYGDMELLVQGTLYSDVIESGGDHGSSAETIKSHHNVGGLPEDMDFELIEPLRTLFKDEVRRIGTALELPRSMVWRHPFPGPGLAIRIIGDVTAERLDTLQQADAILLEEVRSAGLYDEMWQCFAVLPTIRSVGVQGDGRTYGHPIVIRAVTSEDAMTADWARLPHDVVDQVSRRIVNEVPGINRVLLDVTAKPPGTIEWE